MPFARGGNKCKAKSNCKAKGEKKSDRKRKWENSKKRNVSQQEEVAAVAKAKSDVTTNADAENNAATAAIVLKKARTTMKERAASGHTVTTQTEMRIYIKVAYSSRFKEPDESEWKRIAQIMSNETGVRSDTIKAIFKKCRFGDPAPEKQKKGAGRVVKLPRDNAGLVFAALVINTGGSLQQATDMCNRQNAKDGLDVTITRNTLMRTFKKIYRRRHLNC